ncbi:SAM-dependent MidA family methyltransferase [Alkalispirillum mobile]|uniref:SAM-dependent MidA family methyltransferase n=1 Tax=Alkalispirillum mobile TaxID=85925 RepID=A0A498BZT7_9GAMM|nr:SAM-dependent methyltransferase [Alkalispirillum mobile]RLK48217.1 SAM-dependent MidA family methyltransferase [Alkalispirillum mobile]
MSRQRPPALDLPAPDAEARAHSETLQARIRQAIESADGWLPFDRYMTMALYEPGLGYYSAGAPRFGSGGDFTTAPLISPLFGRTLAHTVQRTLQALELPAGEGEVMELGAGTGRMAADLLLELEGLEQLPARYLILEVSAALRQEQRNTLAEHAPHLLERVEWLEALPEAPISGVILANEVLDALPFRCFQREDAHILERGVALNEGGQLHWTPRPADDDLAEHVRHIEHETGQRLPAGYRSECLPQLAEWLRDTTRCLARGLVLYIDYGYPRREYYLPDRHMGTLLCHYRHRAHEDPFFWPGLQDITAFVDFTAVAEAALAADLDVLGFTSQAQYLLAAGLPQLADAAMAKHDDDMHRLRIAQEVRRLTLPAELGERFKVLPLGRDLPPLPEFIQTDQRHRL